MKILMYKASVIIFNLCLLVTAIITPALMLASSPEYYSAEFEKNGIYSRENEDGSIESCTVWCIDGDYRKYAVFTDGQLDELTQHIIDYLFGDKDTFYLEMDNVLLNGVVKNGVSIFGETAVLHMADVKLLMKTALAGAIISAIIAIALLILFIVKRKEVAEFLIKYTLIFYGILLFLIILFCLWTLSDIDWIGNANYFLDQMWTNIHHLLFPFQPEKYENSFFNDTLTQILTLELFLDAVFIVLGVVALLLTAWFVLAFIIKKKNVTS